MIISNKLNLGDVVYYPASDLRLARIIKDTVTAIMVVQEKGKRVVAYQTNTSQYGIKSEDIFKTAGPARKRLLNILSESKKKMIGDFDKAIKNVSEAKLKTLVVSNDAPQGFAQ